MSREDLEAYVALSIKLGRLWDEGKGETPEADAVRDESDAPWFAMTEAERDWIREHAGEPVPADLSESGSD